MNPAWIEQPHSFEFAGKVPLQVKVPGSHRWVAMMMSNMSQNSMEELVARDASGLINIDQENMFRVIFGCWDCLQLVDQVNIRSQCHAHRFEE